MAKREKRTNNRQQENSNPILSEWNEMVRLTEEKKRNNERLVLQCVNFMPDIKYKNRKQKDLVKAIHSNKIIFVAGSAGSGKTIMVLKAALEILKDTTNQTDKILITKPIIEAAESIGFLPGSKEEKIDPYMHSFYANFKKLIGEIATQKLIMAEVIKPIPLAFMRGATFSNAIAILDESQNVTVTGLKLFISRLGEHSKLIVIGDIDQTDLKLKKGEKTGIEDAFERFKGIEGVAFIEFTEDDIVRNDILIDVMKRYKNRDFKLGNNENNENTNS